MQTKVEREKVSGGDSVYQVSAYNRGTSNWYSEIKLFQEYFVLSVLPGDPGKIHNLPGKPHNRKNWAQEGFLSLFFSPYLYFCETLCSCNSFKLFISLFQNRCCILFPGLWLLVLLLVLFCFSNIYEGVANSTFCSTQRDI